MMNIANTPHGAAARGAQQTEICSCEFSVSGDFALRLVGC